jgi:hypothetical protein
MGGVGKFVLEEVSTICRADADENGKRYGFKW